MLACKRIKDVSYQLEEAINKVSIYESDCSDLNPLLMNTNAAHLQKKNFESIYPSHGQLLKNSTL